MKKRIVIFISGSGSNMEALITASRQSGYPAEIVAVIADERSAGGLVKAERYHVPTYVFERKDYASKDDHETAILACLDAIKPDLICLAGYMRLISGKVIAPYEGKILNIHPSLLPLFRGLNTHQRALDSGMKIAGCTIHLVTEGMDEGPILAQAAVPVLKTDTAETLATRVLKAEHVLYAQTLQNFIANNAKTDITQKILSY